MLIPPVSKVIPLPTITLGFLFFAPPKYCMIMNLDSWTLPWPTERRQSIPIFFISFSPKTLVLICGKALKKEGVQILAGVLANSLEVFTPTPIICPSFKAFFEAARLLIWEQTTDTLFKRFFDWLFLPLKKYLYELDSIVFASILKFQFSSLFATFMDGKKIWTLLAFELKAELAIDCVNDKNSNSFSSLSFLPQPFK